MESPVDVSIPDLFASDMYMSSGARTLLRHLAHTVIFVFIVRTTHLSFVSIFCVTLSLGRLSLDTIPSGPL